jgi:hypothetical protein
MSSKQTDEAYAHMKEAYAQASKAMTETSKAAEKMTEASAHWVAAQASKAMAEASKAAERMKEASAQWETAHSQWQNNPGARPRSQRPRRLVVPPAVAVRRVRGLHRPAACGHGRRRPWRLE